MKNNLNIVGSKRSDGTEREQNDFYATDPQAISDLQKFVNIKGNVWECACGDGALSRELFKIKGVKKVHSTDLINRGYVYGHFQDFLESERLDHFDWIITNPPYKHGLEFAKKALKQADNVAFLMKLVWLESGIRKPFFEKNPPSKVLVYSKRLGVYKNNIKPKNSGLIAYAWFVWEKEYQNCETVIKWI